jgi:hypothetical protein
VIDLRGEQHENAFNSTRVNSESISNEIDDGEWQDDKHLEQKI